MILVTAANGHVGVPSLRTAAASAMTQCGLIKFAVAGLLLILSYGVWRLT